VCHRTTHEPMPGGVELDLVDAIAVTIVGVQYRLVEIGEPPVLTRRS
jgi:hypothetical protein